MTDHPAHSLPDFGLVDHPGALVLTRLAAIPWVRYVLEGGATLYEAATVERDRLELPGRSPVFAIPAKEGREHPQSRPDQSGVEARYARRWAIRHFSRGGKIMPALLGDRYLRAGVPRPFHEAHISEEVRARGVPTPRVMAAAVYPGSLFYRADLVTEFIPGSTDLLGSLFDTRRKGVGGASERLDALRAAGTLVRSLSRAGLAHGDLHGGNILLQWEGGLPRALVLDLDRARLLGADSLAPPGPMLHRLLRSLRKWEGRTGLSLTEKEWATLEKTARS